MIDLLRIATRRLGYGLLRVTRASPGVDHELVVPTATWSPWNLDADFLATYEHTRPHTLKDKYRCWELWSLLAECRHLPGAIVEVGVWRGGSGALLATRARALGIDDPVYLCDTFRGVAKAGDDDPGYEGGEHANTSKERVRALVHDRLGLDRITLLEGVFPEDTADQIPDPQIRLCHIDVDVYRSARDTLEWVWPRLPRGGVVIFDDYGFRHCDGVTKIVDEQRERDDRIVHHNLNGHGVVVKLSAS